MRVGGPLGGQGIVRSYHTASPNIVHNPIHGSVCIYANYKPVTGGIQAEAGTLATIVYENDKPFILTNQHVLMGITSPLKKVGDPVYSCGDATHSSPIGTFYKTLEEKNPWPLNSNPDTVLGQIGAFHDSGLAIPLIPVTDENKWYR